ncbi:hypothetical protein HY933_04120 [Candidatus Falkowbacteria bacterium]|nr:hypothetical protein [Candidatus Falkowbacteria bacterium]
MIDRRLIRKLDLVAGERAALVVRRSLLVYFWRLLLVLLLFLLPFFLLYPLFQWPTWGPLIFSLLLLVGLLCALKLYISWRYNCLVATNRRFIDIDQRGFFDRVVSEAALEKIEDLNYRRQGLLQSLFRYGSIQYYIAPGKTKIIIRGVKHPAAVCQQLARLLDGVTPTRRGAAEQQITTVDDLKQLLSDMRDQLGVEQFDRVVREVAIKRPLPQDRSRQIENFLDM